MIEPQKDTPFWEDYGAKLQRTKDTITKHVALWASLLGLDYWDIDSDFLNHAPKGEDAEHMSADCSVQWEYQRATIRWVLSNIHARSEAELEDLVVHELCHILVREMRDAWVCVGEHGTFLIKNEERVVTNMARAYIRTRRKALEGEK